MGLQQILLLISPTDYMKEMYLLQEMSLHGKALATLHPSLEPFLQMRIGEDTGQLQCSPQYTSFFLVWVQDNLGWGLGFGIPTLFMALAIGSFFAGTPLYRFQKPGGSPLTRMCQVLVATFRKWNVEVPHDTSLLYELQEGSSIEGSPKLEHSDELSASTKRQ